MYMYILNHDFDANYFGKLYKINQKVSLKLYKNYLISLCKKLKKIGRNEKIAIKSPSGKKIEIKYKKLEHYLKQGYTQL